MMSQKAWFYKGNETCDPTRTLPYILQVENILVQRIYIKTVRQSFIVREIPSLECSCGWLRILPTSVRLVPCVKSI